MSQSTVGRKKEGGRKAKGAYWTALFAFLTIMIIGMTQGSMLSYASQVQEAPLTMEVTYGFGDMARGDRYLPVKLSFENHEQEAFAGTAEFLTTTSSMEPYQYSYPIQIDGVSSKEEVYYIPLGVKGDQIFVTLRDKDGAEVIRKRLKLNISSDVSEVFVGLFSDEPEDMNYLDEVGIRYGSVKTKLVPMTEKEAPGEALGYDQMDLLIITNYEMDRLSGEQQEAVLKWVENGGTLLFGGGEYYKKNMGRFADELLDPTYMGPQLKEVNLGAEYSQNAPQDAVLSMVCTDIDLKNGSTLIPGDDFPLLSYVQRGKGRIAVAAFDLKDIGEFCENHPSFMERLLTLVFGETTVDQLAQMDFYGFSNLYFSVQGLINTGNVDRLPNVVLYTVVIIFYILLIGPGLYQILKKKSLQRYYLGGVAACSLLFTAIVYAMGVKTRFQTPFFTYATVLDATDGREEEETFVNIRSPYNKPYTVTLNPSYTVRPITKSYYYDSMSTSKFIGNEAAKTALVHGENETELRIRDTAAFTPKLFSLKKKIAGGSQAIGIEGTVESFDGEIRGSVTNQFGYRLENAALLLYGKAVLLGDMEPGQVVSLDDKEVLNYPLNYTYALTQAVTGGDSYEKTDISDSGYMLAQERSRLLSFYMDQNMVEYTPDARLVAFSPNKNEKEFLAGGDFITEGLTMVTASLPVNRIQDGQIYRCVLEQEPSVISGTYQARYNSMYTSEPAEPSVVEYSLGNDLELDRVLFEYLSPVFRENPRYPYLSMFKGKMYFYNYNTGHNDLMAEGKNEYTVEELRSYLSPDNTLTIKYVSENTGEAGWDKLLPVLYVIGREK